VLSATKQEFESRGLSVHYLSGVTGEGLGGLLLDLVKTLDEVDAEERALRECAT
jgi:hypothetical protein